MVRRAMLKLSPSNDPAARQYLYLATRLFAASSGTYDPLIRDYASPDLSKDQEVSYVSSFRTAQLAVGQSAWASKGITSSAEYLKQIFEDDGEELEGHGILPKADIPSPAMEPASPPLMPLRYGWPPYDHMSTGQLTPNPAPKPYRASSLSSVESVNDFPSNMTVPASPRPSPLPPVRPRRNLTPRSPSCYGFPRSPFENLPSQNSFDKWGPYPASSDINPYFPTGNIDNSHMHRRTSTSDPVQQLTITTSQGTYNVPIEVHETSRLADERRRRITGASARFRQRRKDKEREHQTNTEKLQQQTRDLERRIPEIEQQRDYYRQERDRYREAISGYPDLEYLMIQAPPSPPSPPSTKFEGPVRRGLPRTHSWPLQGPSESQ
ncbi:hypothetical protein BDZ45DRAFT_72958 [Acephala macrosclerotiorum]|nr:hypothetical protein BDZ45DRAFT_72958 [Acephala macrosclerotiorum]